MNRSKDNAWNDDDWDEWDPEDMGDWIPETYCEWGLPLRAENFVNGVPVVTVDYFDLVTVDFDDLSHRLRTLEAAIPDECAETPRFLIFEKWSSTGVYTPRDIIAIATLREGELRLETGRAEDTQSVRAALEAVLGSRVRYRERRIENPFEDDWALG